MQINDKIEELTQRITQLLPTNAQVLKEDFEANIHSLLQSSLSKMNLVTREEFDIQTALLERTREKLDQIEKQLNSAET